MVYAKIVKERENNANMEILQIHDSESCWSGNEHLYVSENPSGICRGFRITQEDLERLYKEKKIKSDLEIMARETEEERKRKEELEEIKKWKEAKASEERKWYRRILRFWKKY